MEKERESSYLNLKETELRLGLPGSDLPEKRNDSRKNSKRASPEESGSSTNISSISDAGNDASVPPRAKAQIVGWPPIRSYRKNNLQTATKKSSSDHAQGGGILYVKVSMDGAPYLRKIDLKLYNSYPDLLKATENMFMITIEQYSQREGYSGSDYTPTYEDKDGDWMLVGDVPWTIFVSTCKRLRIMKSSEAKGLGKMLTSSQH